MHPRLKISQLKEHIWSTGLTLELDAGITEYISRSEAS